MSKESKLAKKELKAAKKAAKVEKKQAKQYEKLVVNINKKNAKSEKKAAKKGKPFVPVEIPTQEEAFAAAVESKPKQIIKMVILLLLIIYLIYFLIMWFNYVAPVTTPEEEKDKPSAAAVYDRYENQHEITTTPTYNVAEAKELLKQVLHDNWYTIGYSSDPSSGSINNTGKSNVNNAECYMFTASGKKYAVASNLSSVYVESNGNYVPLTFHRDELLDFATKD